jgi:hypothetical protein
MRVRLLRLGMVLAVLWLGGCAGNGVRCDTRLRPINAPVPAVQPPRRQVRAPCGTCS